MNDIDKPIEPQSNIIAPERPYREMDYEKCPDGYVLVPKPMGTITTGRANQCIPTTGSD